MEDAIGALVFLSGDFRREISIVEFYGEEKHRIFLSRDADSQHFR